VSGIDNHLMFFNSPSSQNFFTNIGIAVGEWNCFEYRVELHDSAGSVEIFLNSTPIFATDSIDTVTGFDLDYVNFGHDGAYHGTNAPFADFDNVQYRIGSELIGCNDFFNPLPPTPATIVPPSSTQTVLGINSQLLIIALNVIFILIAIRTGGLFFWLVPIVLSILLFTTVDDAALKSFAIMLLLAQAVGAYTTLQKGEI
jgi:hypothetical protein